MLEAMRRDSLPGQHVFRVGSAMLLALAATALLTVLVGLIQSPRPLPTDEGLLAHIFQLAIAALLPSSLLVVATADWRNPRPVVQVLAVAGMLVVFAFAALYFLEHVR